MGSNPKQTAMLKLAGAAVVNLQCGVDNVAGPDWAADPPDRYSRAHFRVIKDEEYLSRIAIGQKPYYVLGRVATCDIVAEHKSISRQHAFVGWDSFGTLFVQDLDTSWGT